MLNKVRLPVAITALLSICFAYCFMPISVLAQGCGPSNPNCIVPTAPPSTSNNQAASTAFVAGAVSSAALTPLDVFVIAGQSNAEGAILLDNGVRSPSVPNTVLQYYGGTISAANDPVGNAIIGSAWPAFGNLYYAATGRKILFVPSAVGGTHQCDANALVDNGSWDAGGTLFAAAVSNANAAMATAQAAGYAPVFRGTLWSQGENDASSLGVVAATIQDQLQDTVSGGPYSAGATSVTVGFVGTLAIGQSITIVLDNGAPLYTLISNVSGSTITFSPAVPAGRQILTGAAVWRYVPAQYQNCFTTMIGRWRSATIDGATYPEMPFYISLTGGPAGGDNYGYQAVRLAQSQVAEQDSYTKVVFRNAVDFITRGMVQNTNNFTFTGSISGTTLTVTVPNANYLIEVGTLLSGSGVATGTTIAALLTGTGGVGTYTVNNSQTTGSVTLVGGSSSLHYIQEAYNEMGRGMAGCVLGLPQCDSFQHTTGVNTYVNLTGTLRTSDQISVTVTSSAIVGSPVTVGPVTVGGGSTFASILASLLNDIVIGAPELTNAGIFASITGNTLVFTQPSTLSPQAVIATSVTAGSPTIPVITTGVTGGAYESNLYYAAGPVTIGATGGGIDNTNLFNSAGIYNPAPAGTDNNLLRIANTTNSGSFDQRTGILFQPGYAALGPTYGGLIESQHDQALGQTNLLFGGYASGTKTLRAGMPYNGGVWVGPCTLGSKGEANGVGSLTLCNNEVAGTDNNLLYLENQSGNAVNQLVGIVLNPSNQSNLGRSIKAINDNINGIWPLAFGGYNGSSYVEQMRLDSSGNLLIGTTTSPAGSGSLSLTGNIVMKGSSTGTTTLATANASSSGYTATLPAATDTIVELAATQTLTNKTIAYASNTLTGVAASNASTTVASATCTLGSSCTPNVANLAGYTASTWVPVITAAGTAGTPAYTTQVGSYEQIGRQVTARFQILLSGWSGSPSGTVTITGLPVPSANVAGDYGTCSIGLYVISSAVASLSGFVSANSSVINLYYTPAAGAASQSPLAAVTVGTAPLIVGACHYHT